MEQKAYIAGVGMTPFGNAIDQSLSQLASTAINEALKDAGIGAKDLGAAYMGNAAAGVITGQVCVPGQVVLRNMGIGRIPVINVENACATSATAFQQAATMVTLGVYDVVLVCGYEKLYHKDKEKTFSVFTGAIDVDQIDAIKAGLKTRNEAIGAELDMSQAGITRSIFIDIYATWAREHMHRYGTSPEQLAAVSAKNSFHGSLNPLSQFRDRVSIEQVLAAREIVSPLTLPMCAPIGDGGKRGIGRFPQGQDITHLHRRDRFRRQGKALFLQQAHQNGSVLKAVDLPGFAVIGHGVQEGQERMARARFRA